MRRAILFAALAALTSLVPAADATTQPTGFAFGRLGGNIRPYIVTIANSGVVRTFGAVMVERGHITTAQLAQLNRVATETHFTVIPTSTNCHGSMPDVATTFVRVGARTVRVHGSCAPRYQRMLKALMASVHLDA
jgi:hypothetical protein